jgi:HlyD family secretion protein
MSPARCVAAALIAAAALAGAGALGWRLYDVGEADAGVLRLTGNVDVREVDLAFRAPGRITEVTVEEGDAVSAGEVVARLEASDFEDLRRLAQARAAARRARLEALEAGSRPEEIEQARAEVARARAAKTLARSERDRQAELAARDVAAHRAHEQAEAAFEEAAARLKAAQATLELVEAGPRAEAIAAARAALAADQAAVGLAERRLSDARLKAPSDGVIHARIREPGAVVAPGAPVLTLSLASPLWVRSYVEEPDLGRLSPGMPAEIRTDAGEVYSGRVGFISPKAEFTPKTVQTREQRTSLVYRFRVVVDPPAEGLRQGMPVDVILRPRGGG